MRSGVSYRGGGEREMKMDFDISFPVRQYIYEETWSSLFFSLFLDVVDVGLSFL